ncbi:MAG: F0F1 ATP synthase subunit delta [Bacteroidaceae bacterium]|nr:F0F1 ATP synthase subunit delta [Bacteroidaceae bacterium]
MEVGIISMRYAKALMAYAKEKGAEDSLYKEMKTLARNFHEQGDLVKTLDDPILGANDKFSLICTAANGNDSSSKVFERFIHIVLENKRESYLMFMSLMYIDLYKKEKHIGNAKLVTAVPVDEARKERIRESASKVLHADMRLEAVVDPSILGGFVFDVNDYRLDASILTQLKQMRQKLIDKNRRIV